MSDEPRIETRLGHLPALDGVRGLAVIIVLLYHHSITSMNVVLVDYSRRPLSCCWP